MSSSLAGIGSCFHQTFRHLKSVNHSPNVKKPCRKKSAPNIYFKIPTLNKF